MKRLLSMLLIFTVVLVLGVSMAHARDVGEIFETAGDTLLNDNANCPMLFEPYVAKTFKDAIKGKADLRAELSYQCSIDDLTENNRVNLKVGLEF